MTDQLVIIKFAMEVANELCAEAGKPPPPIAKHMQWLIAEVERLRAELTELSGRHQGAMRFFDEIQRVMPDAKSELSKFHEDLQACNKRLLADAERWRYVRENPEILEGEWGRLTPLEADAAVDAVRRPEK